MVFWLIFTTLLTVSCAGGPKTAAYLDPAFREAPLATLALLPVTYDPDYDQPIEVNLSRIIRHQARQELVKKGYDVVLVGPHYGRGMSDLISAAPSLLAELGDKEADAVILVHVNFHVGIDFGEYRSGEPFSTIDIYGDARLVTGTDPRELWRDEGRGVDLTGGGGFFHRGTPSLRMAISNLAKNLFATLPPRTRQP